MLFVQMYHVNFIVLISLLYLTQRISTQITSESEAINKIINDILIQAERKNIEKKNPDPLELIWKGEITKSEQETTDSYLKNFEKPKIHHHPFLKIEPQQANLNLSPHSKLQDILPELKSSYPLVRTTVSLPWTTKTSTKKKTTTAEKKKTNNKAKTTSETFRKQQLLKNPGHHDAIYNKNIPSDPHEQKFSKTLRKKPIKVTTNKNVEIVDQDKPSYADKKSSLKLTTTDYGPYSSATSITEKDWTGLKYVEDLVKSVPDYTSTPLNAPFSRTLNNSSKFVMITTGMTFNYGETINDIEVSKKKTTAKLDKEVTDDMKKYSHFTTDLSSVFNEEAKDAIVVFKEQNAGKVFHETGDDRKKYQKINHFTENYTPKTATTFKYDHAIDVNYNFDNANTNVKQDLVKGGIAIEKKTLNELLQKIAATVVTKTAKDIETSLVTLGYTEENKVSTPTREISTDLYLLIEPKNKFLKSFFTLPSVPKDNIKTVPEKKCGKILGDLGLDTMTEPNFKISGVNNINKNPKFSTPVFGKGDGIKKSDMADLYKDVIESHDESLKGEHLKKKPKPLHEKITKHINWESIKKFFGHDRVCKCKCKENRTLCTVCAASDAVMRELAFEFNNLSDYMNAHCTEIQTFFWMNPSDGKKLRDTVHRIDRTFHDYYKRVKGKCTGRTCKTFSTYLDKRRHSDKMKLKRKYIREILRDLEMRFDIN